MSFEMVHAKKLLRQNVFWQQNFHIEITGIVAEFITLKLLHNFVNMMQSMNGIVC